MLQNMLCTSLTPLSLRTERESWENQPFTTVWPEYQQKIITKTIKKKKKRSRTAFTTEQIRVLESTFSRFKYVNPVTRRELSESLNIDDKCIKVWFQNRRMKEKREESNSDSSNESMSNEVCSSTLVSPLPHMEMRHNSISVTPPLQTPFEQISTFNPPSPHLHPEAEKSEPYQYYPWYDSESAYQLPTYFNVPQNVYEHTSANPGFYQDFNVYPTHYYPIDTMSNATTKDTSFENQYWEKINSFNNVDSCYISSPH